MRTIVLATAIAISISRVASAETVPADGYLYARSLAPNLTEGCVEQGNGGIYVGVGPALSFPASGGTRSIVFVEGGFGIQTVATGLNAIGDCVYDATNDTLYVTDSGAEFSGATTGDTVFGIPGTQRNVPVAGHEVLPSGSIPQAFGIDLTPTGLLVSNAAGGGNGEVIAIDLSGVTPSATTFATGFDYAGGLVVEDARVLVSEAIEPSFESAITSFSTAGVPQGTFSGPRYDHGSIDLDIAPDGGVLVTGTPTLVSIDAASVVTPLVTGLDGGTGFDAFGGGVAVDDFTGRIDFLASSFSGADDDRSVHHLVPIDRLVPGGGNKATDCALELFGVELVARSPGGTARSAICEDGAACDADGTANGQCVFPLGLCLNVPDPRFPDCEPTAVASTEVVASFFSGEMAEMVTRLGQMVPTAESTCLLSAGVRVNLRTLADGTTRRGKASFRFRTVTEEENPRKDNDVVRLVCEPAGS